MYDPTPCSRSVRSNCDIQRARWQLPLLLLLAVTQAFAQAPDAAPNARKGKTRPRGGAPGISSVAPTDSQPLSPAEALKAFRIPAELELKPLLAEPAVAQPLFLNFDERGRMWVVQYRCHRPIMSGGGTKSPSTRAPATMVCSTGRPPLWTA